MKEYLKLLEDVITNGAEKEDRTGTGTISVFGRQMRFDLTEGFPILTTKKVIFKSVVEELLWFLSGSTNNNDLNDRGVHIWDGWALENGDLGPIYGKQWRSWEAPNGETIDQISYIVETLKTNPSSRRLVVSGWNPADLPDESISPQENVKRGKAALPPCHTLFQFYTRKLSLAQRRAQLPMDHRLRLMHGFPTTEELDDAGVPKYFLDCQLYQRAVDVVIGLPFNISSYCLLQSLIAHQVDMVPGEFIHTSGDAHVYKNHMRDDIVNEQLRRNPEQRPELILLRKPDSIDGYRYEDIDLLGYNPRPFIKAPVSI